MTGSTIAFPSAGCGLPATPGSSTLVTLRLATPWVIASFSPISLIRPSSPHELTPRRDGPNRHERAIVRGHERDFWRTAAVSPRGSQAPQLRHAGLCAGWLPFLSGSERTGSVRVATPRILCRNEFRHRGLVVLRDRRQPRPLYAQPPTSSSRRNRRRRTSFYPSRLTSSRSCDRHRWTLDRAH